MKIINHLKSLLEIQKFPVKNNIYENLYEKYCNFTMIDKKLFIDNLILIDKHFKEFNLKNTIVECGVWRGGMIAAIADVIGSSFIYHMFDSFEGLPPAKDIDGEAAMKWQINIDSKYYFENCKAEQEIAESVLQMSSAEEFIFHKGWFEDTIPHCVNEIGKISLLRLDGDWYDSTMTCFDNFYPLVEDNGLVIVDDYFAWDGCSKAVHDYLSKIKSNSRIRTNDTLLYIIKNENGRQYNL